MPSQRATNNTHDHAGLLICGPAQKRAGNSNSRQTGWSQRWRSGFNDCFNIAGSSAEGIERHGGGGVPWVALMTMFPRAVRPLASVTAQLMKTVTSTLVARPEK